MKLKLISLPKDSLRIGRPSEMDLFNVQGKLLYAKGNIITPAIMELFHNQELYIFQNEYEDDQANIESLQRIYADAHLIRPDDLLCTMKLVEGIITEFEQQKHYIEFKHFKSYDPYTYVHSVNVANLSALIAVYMGYRGSLLHNICLSALLHDVGKLVIPLSILNKPSGLTAQEFARIKEHPSAGYKMLRKSDLPPEVLLVIQQHHERWNGRGYPARLINRGIHPYAQIVAVADVFEALIADRPYRKGIPPYHALDMILTGSGADFAPDVVDAFRQSLVLYPENTRVTLNTGEVGTVIRVHDNNPTRPVVRILCDEQGHPMRNERLIDLLQDLTRYISQVEFNVG